MGTLRAGRILAAVVTVAALVAGCGASNNRSAGSSVENAKSAARGQGGGAVSTSGRLSAGPAGGPRALPPLGRPPVADRSIVYTAALTVRARNVAAAAAQAQSIATGAGGYVLSSGTVVDPAGGAATSADVVLKVPPGSFSTVLRSLLGLGTSLGSSQHVDDVTDQVVDVAARLQSQQASVARVRALLAQARTVGEVVAVESELTKREADLESLLGRQRALDAQVALSTITLRLVSPAAASVGPRSAPRGFLAGLRAGWHAFVRALVASLTVLGVLLPFIVTVGLLLLAGVPLRRLLLARRQADAVRQ